MAQTRHRSSAQTHHTQTKKWHQQKRWIFSSLGIMPPLGIVLLWRTSWSTSSKIIGTLLSTLILMMAIAQSPSEPENQTITAQPITPAATAAPAAPESVAEQPVVAAQPVEAETAEVATPQAAAPTTPPPATVVPPAAYQEAIALATSATQSTAQATTSNDWAKIADTWQSSINVLNEVADGGNFAAEARRKLKEYQVNYDYAIAQMNTTQIAEKEAIAQQQRQEQEARFAQMQREAVAAAQAETQTVSESDGYVSGTCSYLRAIGVGSNFTPGDPNYTSKRDRDGDGVACEY